MTTECGTGEPNGAIECGIGEEGIGDPTGTAEPNGAIECGTGVATWG